MESFKNIIPKLGRNIFRKLYAIEAIYPSVAMYANLGKKPIPTRGGGSIPIEALFEKEFTLNRDLH